jgi:hypothetical protein
MNLLEKSVPCNGLSRTHQIQGARQETPCPPDI